MLALLLNPEDTVATALSDAAAGDTAEIILGREKTGRLVTALDAVPVGFKIAVSPMKKGSLVIKYGLPIGVASRDIAPGSLVHIHNIEGARGRGDLKENAKCLMSFWGSCAPMGMPARETRFSFFRSTGRSISSRPMSVG